MLCPDKCCLQAKNKTAGRTWWQSSSYEDKYFPSGSLRWGERCIWRRDRGLLCPPILTLHPSFCSPGLASTIPPSSSLVASLKRSPLRDAAAPLPLRPALPCATGKNCIAVLYERRTLVVILRKCTNDKLNEQNCQTKSISGIPVLGNFFICH